MDPNNSYINNVTDLGGANYTSTLTDNQLAVRIQQLNAWKNTHLSMGTEIQEFNGEVTTVRSTPILDEQITWLENKVATIQSKLDAMGSKESLGPQKQAHYTHLENVKSNLESIKLSRTLTRFERKQAWVTKYKYMVEATTVYGIILTDRNLG